MTQTVGKQVKVSKVFNLIQMSLFDLRNGLAICSNAAIRHLGNYLTKSNMPVNLNGKMTTVFHLKISERKNVLGLSEFSLVDVQPSPYDSRG